MTKEQIIPKNQTVKKHTKIGLIISDKMDKTRVVEIIEKRTHPMYKKTFLVSRRINTHDAKNEFHKGDKVEIMETKPFSKTKAWEIVGKIES